MKLYQIEEMGQWAQLIIASPMNVRLTEIHLDGFSVYGLLNEQPLSVRISHQRDARYLEAVITLRDGHMLGDFTLEELSHYLWESGSQD